MTGPRPLADVEAEAQRIADDPDTLNVDEAVGDLWRRQAYATATRIRAMHRTITMLARTYLPDSTARRAVEHIAADIVGPELVDQDPATSDGERRG